jgi:hypothetical protein
MSTRQCRRDASLSDYKRRRLQDKRAEIKNILGHTASAHGEFTLELDDLPAMLQFAITSGVLSKDHVMYQNMRRFLLRAFGLKHHHGPYTDEGEFNTLRQFGVMQLMLHGASATKFAVGRGLEGMVANGVYADPYEFVTLHNSGQFITSQHF